MGMPEYVSSHCVVCYLDIFNFSHLATKIPLRTFNALLKIWNKIEAKFKDEGALTYLFSDSCFILYPVDDRENGLTAVKRCIQDTEIILDYYLEEKFLVRGGVACGEVWYSENLLLGQPVINAVRAENHTNGPIVVFPIEEMQNLLKDEVINAEIKRITLVQNKVGQIKCCVVLPTNLTYFVKLNEALYHSNTIYSPGHTGYWPQIRQLVEEEILQCQRNPI